jgi:hypothetical protein
MDDTCEQTTALIEEVYRSRDDFVSALTIRAFPRVYRDARFLVCQFADFAGDAQLENVTKL